MLNKKFLLLSSIVALVYAQESNNAGAETNFSTKKNKKSSVIETNGNQENDFEAAALELTGKLPDNTDSAFEDAEVKATRITKLDQEKARADIKAWVENLNCSKTLLGPFKCQMVKKLAKRYEHTKDVEVDKITKRIKGMLKKLEEDNVELDPEMKNLIEKYRFFL